MCFSNPAHDHKIMNEILLYYDMKDHLQKNCNPRLTKSNFFFLFKIFSNWHVIVYYRRGGFCVLNIFGENGTCACFRSQDLNVCKQRFFKIIFCVLGTVWTLCICLRGILIIKLCCEINKLN